MVYLWFPENEKNPDPLPIFWGASKIALLIAMPMAAVFCCASIALCASSSLCFLLLLLFWRVWYQWLWLDTLIKSCNFCCLNYRKMGPIATHLVLIMDGCILDLLWNMSRISCRGTAFLFSHNMELRTNCFPLWSRMLDVLPVALRILFPATLPVLFLDTLPVILCPVALLVLLSVLLPVALLDVLPVALPWLFPVTLLVLLLDKLPVLLPVAPLVLLLVTPLLLLLVFLLAALPILPIPYACYHL